MLVQKSYMIQVLLPNLVFWWQSSFIVHSSSICYKSLHLCRFHHFLHPFRLPGEEILFSFLKLRFSFVIFGAKILYKKCSCKTLMKLKKVFGRDTNEEIECRLEIYVGDYVKQYLTNFFTIKRTIIFFFGTQICALDQIWQTDGY